MVERHCCQLEALVRAFWLKLRGAGQPQKSGMSRGVLLTKRQICTSLCRCSRCAGSPSTRVIASYNLTAHETHLLPVSITADLRPALSLAACSHSLPHYTRKVLRSEPLNHPTRLHMLEKYRYVLEEPHTSYSRAARIVSRLTAFSVLLNIFINIVYVYIHR